MPLYGADADAPQSPEAPHPAQGHRTDGRAARKQVLLSLGVSGEGGVPRRIGRRDGNRRDRVETPRAIEEGLAVGLAGVRGLGAESQAYRRRPRGLCLEQGLGFVTCVPRPCAVRQDLEAWGPQPPAWPLWLEKPGRTQAEAPRRWQGRSVIRQVEVAESEARGSPAALRVVVVPSS
jgi:hypothetical protein